MLIIRYILQRCLFNTGLMLLAFVMLFALFNVLGQLGDVGKGDYATNAMLIYILLQLPNFMYLLMPLAVLIGVMMSMLSLVNYSEFAIIRTSGVSLRKVMYILLLYGAFLAVITFILGEFVAPNANSYAQFYKKSKMHEVVSTQLRSGIWSKDGDNTFVNIKQVMPDSSIMGINILKYNKNLKLEQVVSAQDGRYNQDKGLWVLNKVDIQNYTGNDIIKHYQESYTWATSIEPKFFSVLLVAPEDMSALGLLKYIDHLKNNHQSVRRYRIAFWGKLLYPIACISMALIALAFIPNNRRNVNLGSKLFIGILIGVAFFFSTRLIGFMAFVFNWNAILSATLPTICLLVIGWWVVLRKES